MTPPIDDAFRALIDPERRQMLIVLAEHCPRPDHSFDYLDDVPADSRKNLENISARMHHIHIPMLEAAGFIERPNDDQKFSIGSNFDEIRPLLQCIAEKTIPIG